MKHKITELLSSIRFQIQLEPKYAICPLSNSLRFHVRFPRRTIRVRSCEVNYVSLCRVQISRHFVVHRRSFLEYRSRSIWILILIFSGIG